VDVDGVLERCDQLVARGELDAARDCLEELYLVVPDDPRPLSRLAEVHLAQGQLTFAADVARSALELAPRDLRSLRTRTLALDRLGRTEAAAITLAAALANAPSDVERGRLAFDLRAYDQAAQAWQRVAALTSDPKERARWRGSAGVALALCGRPKQATPHLLDTLPYWVRLEGYDLRLLLVTSLCAVDCLAAAWEQLPTPDDVAAYELDLAPYRRLMETRWPVKSRPLTEFSLELLRRQLVEVTAWDVRVAGDGTLHVVTEAGGVRHVQPSDPAALRTRPWDTWDVTGGFGATVRARTGPALTWRDAATAVVAAEGELTAAHRERGWLLGVAAAVRHSLGARTTVRIEWWQEATFEISVAGPDVRLEIEVRPSEVDGTVDLGVHRCGEQDDDGEDLVRTLEAVPADPEDLAFTIMTFAGPAEHRPEPTGEVGLPRLEDLLLSAGVAAWPGEEGMEVDAGERGTLVIHGWPDEVVDPSQPCSWSTTFVSPLGDELPGDDLEVTGGDLRGALALLRGEVAPSPVTQSSVGIGAAFRAALLDR
jgi:tetratricopeptide (TPR) repeat protein